MAMRNEWRRISRNCAVLLRRIRCTLSMTKCSFPSSLVSPYFLFNPSLEDGKQVNKMISAHSQVVQRDGHIATDHMQAQGLSDKEQKYGLYGGLDGTESQVSPYEEQILHYDLSHSAKRR